ncbi:unnamed protein product, partial [Urochloa humidicola]
SWEGRFSSRRARSRRAARVPFSSLETAGACSYVDSTVTRVIVSLRWPRCFVGPSRAPMPLRSGRNSFLLPRRGSFWGGELDLRRDSLCDGFRRARSTTGVVPFHHATWLGLPSVGACGIPIHGLQCSEERGGIGYLAMGGGLLPPRSGGPRRGRRDDDARRGHKSGDGGARPPPSMAAPSRGSC